MFKRDVEESFAFGEFTGIVFRASNFDRMNFDRLYLALLPQTGSPLNEYKERFARCVAQSKDVRGLPFDWPDVNATPDKLREAFECWMKFDAPLTESWYRKILAVDQATGDPRYVPVYRLTPEQAADPNSEDSAANTKPSKSASSGS